MNHWSLVGLLLIISLSGQIFSLARADRVIESQSLTLEQVYALPAPVLKISALEFDGLLSDMIFLKTLSFYGKTFERKETPRVRQSELDWINDSLTAATELDPYFMDPYYLANSNLAWEGNRVEQANVLLEKGTHFRSWDWLLPFYAGFNAHYFLHDNAKASELLAEAARRPGASPLLATLSARFAYEANQIENAIIFLEEMLRQATDDYSRLEFGKRLAALRDILALEKAVVAFQTKIGRAPNTINELVEHGVLAEIPRESYGGTYDLDHESGAVRSSTDFGKKPATGQ